MISFFLLKMNIKKTTRKGDGAPISVIQLLPGEGEKKKGKKKTKPVSGKPKVKKENKIKEPEKSDQEDDS